jgi:chemotaxis protein MotA
LDIASLTGIVAGLGLILSAILMGGDFSLFVNIPGIMIVVGGTLSATLLTFPLNDVLSAFKAAVFVFSSKQDNPNDMVFTMIELCKITRKEGLVGLSKTKSDHAFITKACMLISDGADEKIISDTLTIEIDAMKERHFIVQDVFTKMNAYAPAFGMIGTLIGLVQMLANLADPSSVGPAMGVALLTTFYGAVLAFMIFGPIAGKLKSITAKEVMNLQIIFDGASAITQDANPRMVYEKLSSYIPSSQRKALE